MDSVVAQSRASARFKDFERGYSLVATEIADIPLNDLIEAAQIVLPDFLTDPALLGLINSELESARSLSDPADRRFLIHTVRIYGGDRGVDRLVALVTPAE